MAPDIRVFLFLESNKMSDEGMIVIMMISGIGCIAVLICLCKLNVFGTLRK